jgi:hypothetical protein
MSFVHPGRLFIEQHGVVNSPSDIRAYAKFLRVQAGLDGDLPVSLEKIFAHFEIPPPQQVPLPDQQGLLLDGDLGIILLNSSDPRKRQRFTQAHELMELLFSVLPDRQEWEGSWFTSKPGGFKESAKESICNYGAANLLMPPELVIPFLETHGVNFHCTDLLIETFDVSFSAALVQLARLAKGRYAVVSWSMKHKPTEIKKIAETRLQPTLWGEVSSPPQKLRVDWALGGDDMPKIPRHKSVEEDSCIYRAWQQNELTRGRDYFCLSGKDTAWYASENKPFIVDDEVRVLSLIQYLGKGIQGE